MTTNNNNNNNCVSMASYEYHPDSFKLVITPGEGEVVPVFSSSAIHHLHFTNPPTLSFVTVILQSYQRKDDIIQIHIWNNEKMITTRSHRDGAITFFNCFRYYRYLEGLFIGGIPLPMCTLPVHPTLKEFSMTGCNLKNAGSILACPKLSSLNLQFNELADISTVDVGPMLSQFNISQNQIESTVARKLLTNIPSLTDIDLSHNKIDTIHIGSGGPLLDTIDLVLNPVTIEDDENIYDTPIVRVKDIKLSVNTFQDVFQFIRRLPQTQLINVEMFTGDGFVMDYRQTLLMVIRSSTIINMSVNSIKQIDQDKMKYFDGFLRFLILNPSFPNDLIKGTDEIPGLGVYVV